MLTFELGFFQALQELTLDKCNEKLDEEKEYQLVGDLSELVNRVSDN